VQNQQLRKAAVLVAALDRHSADALLAQMPEVEAARVRRAVVELGPFSDDEQEAVLAEFAAASPAASSSSRHNDDDGVEWAPSAAAMATAELPTAARPFQFLAEASAESLTALLEREHPQTVALVLANLPADRAAPVLTSLPEGLQTAVVRRLADLDDAHPEMLQEVERSLSTRCHELERRRKRRESSQQVLVDILSAARQITRPVETEQPVARPAAAPVVPAPRSSWHMRDLLLLDTPSLKEVLAACDEDVMVLALAGAEPSAYARLTRALETHEKRWVESRLAKLGPTRLTDLERAAEQLLGIAARLEQRGALHRAAPRPALAA